MKKAPLILVVFFFFSALLSSHVRAEEKTVNAPDIQSESAVLIDAKSGQILYSKNSDVPMYPASVTKIATAFYAIEKGNMVTD